MSHIPPHPPETLPNEAEQQSPADPNQERHRRRTARWLGLTAVVALSALVGAGAWGHAERQAETVATLIAERDAVPVVRTAVLKPLNTPRQIELTGSTQAFDTATLFARATGYISKRNVDIGSRVHAGDVLAVIAAPELDQQLAQARAQLVQLQAALAQSQANMELAKVTDRRQSQLTTLGWTSQQGGDQARLGYASSVAAVGVARANVQAQQAQVGQLEQLTGFERVVAPFDGVITSRQIDVGSLVTANANSGTPLFSIAHTNVLRVQIYVPQEDYFGLKDGQQAEVTVPELPGRVFHGRLARNASALQDATRTMLAEVDVDNQDGTLAPGIYTVVHLQEPRIYPVISVPSQALIFDKDGLQVAVYQDGVARMRQLDVAADNGGTVDVRAGLNSGDRLILNPPIGVADGMRVTMSAPSQRPFETAAARAAGQLVR
ncbi:MAG TPA: efflux RND transporter periplasmic adaptor subunit [Acetobacteraceae bacterium]|jgi:RND family efflux transporter MFP subunit|nr:efflux RND transporter periplasmic adaptor subunit [Acetobacteraceae bacterium]